MARRREKRVPPAVDGELCPALCQDGEPERNLIGCVIDGLGEVGTGSLTFFSAPAPLQAPLLRPEGQILDRICAEFDESYHVC